MCHLETDDGLNPDENLILGRYTVKFALRLYLKRKEDEKWIF